MTSRQWPWQLWWLLWLIAPITLINWPEAQLPSLSGQLSLFIVAYPILEEIVFRAGLQHLLGRHLPHRWGAISLSNALTSVCFAAAHAILLSPASIAVLLPSLLFGWCYERSNRIAFPIILHVAFNYYATLGFIPMQWFQNVLM